MISLEYVHAQGSSIRLTDLKNRYPWGSVFVTYLSFINLSSVLQDRNKFLAIAQDCGRQPAETLLAFLTLHRRDRAGESVAFIEIDLNRVEAGYKGADDPGGEITQIPWSKEDVVNIAYLIDRQSKTIHQVAGLLKNIKDDASPIKLIYRSIQNLQSDPFLSSETEFIISKDFSKLLNFKESELKNLSISDPDDFNSIADFRKGFNSKAVNLLTIPTENTPALEVQKSKINIMEKALKQKFNSSVDIQ